MTGGNIPLAQLKYFSPYLFTKCMGRSRGDAIAQSCPSPSHPQSNPVLVACCIHSELNGWLAWDLGRDPVVSTTAVHCWAPEPLKTS